MFSSNLTVSVLLLLATDYYLGPSRLLFLALCVLRPSSYTPGPKARTDNRQRTK